MSATYYLLSLVFYPGALQSPTITGIVISGHNASCSSKSNKVPTFICLLGAFQSLIANALLQNFNKTARLQENVKIIANYFSFYHLSGYVSPLKNVLHEAGLQYSLEAHMFVLYELTQFYKNQQEFDFYKRHRNRTYT